MSRPRPVSGWGSRRNGESALVERGRSAPGTRNLSRDGPGGIGLADARADATQLCRLFRRIGLSRQSASGPKRRFFPPHAVHWSP